MTTIQTPGQPSAEVNENSNMIAGDQGKIKKLSSPYSAPTVKEFLVVILVFVLMTAFSWIAYFKLGWFQ